MKSEDELTASAAAAAGLRARAEAVLRENASGTLPDAVALTPEAMHKLLYEMQVYQIELELQNEELRKAEAALNASRARYFELYDLAPVGYCTLGENGLILQANLAAATLLDAPRSVLVLQRFSRFIVTEDQDTLYLRRKQLEKTYEAQSFDLRMLKYDGTRFWGHLVTTAGTEADGTRVVRVVLTDISGQKKHEIELQHARETAEAALQAKGEFFAVMGHEIRTPLNAVIGMTHILLNTPLSAAQRESAEVIRQGGDALLAVVNNLLDFSKMEAGKLEIESLPLNPGRTIERLVILMQATAKARGLTLEVHLGALPRLATGDEARLGQILLNLLSNAIKFSHGGVITVKADAVQTDLGFELKVSVIDPGVGMPQDKLPMLFQPFAQLSPGRARAYGGTGLGLVICKRLTEMMGGWIRVESEPAKGSTFTFQVHLGFANRSIPVPIPALVPGLPRRSEAPSVLNVLVIEDNPVNQLVARSMVELLGHNVSVVDSGAAAIQDLHTRTYDVILTDLMMPEMDGVETTLRLRELENGRKAIIVALTAAATVEDRQRCLSAGMDGFLAKPFTLEGLRSLFAGFGLTAGKV